VFVPLRILGNDAVRHSTPSHRGLPMKVCD
jgi:hypothetical protein